jgi:EAL domain-containing protein (putative c-di-GMP-specific phosphodiesterase class I)
VCDNSNDQIMVQSTIQLAHDLGIEVVAEGVEDLATVDLLRALGCNYAQGYFVGKPMPFKEFCRLTESPVNLHKVA